MSTYYQQCEKACLSLPGAEKDFPFGPEVAVFRVANKMFALLGLDDWKDQQHVARVNLKCDPQEALMLRDVFDAVIPGYHMNKKHWNTVILDGSIPQKEWQRMIQRSYKLVVKGLTQKQKASLVSP